MIITEAKALYQSLEREVFMKQKTCRKLAVAGAGGIAVGVVMLVGGIVCGILSIVNGAVVLGSRKDLEI